MKDQIYESLRRAALRILEQDASGDWDELHKEVRELYERICVLRFLNGSARKASVDVPEEETLPVQEEFFEETLRPENSEETLQEEESEETLREETRELPQEKVEQVQEPISAAVSHQVSTPRIKEDIFCDIASFDPERDDIFVPKVRREEKTEPSFSDEPVEPDKESQKEEEERPLEEKAPEPFLPETPSDPLPSEEHPQAATLNDVFQANAPSLNERLLTDIRIGLNDKIIFVKCLFGEDADRYNQAVEKLNSMTSFEQALRYVEEELKPAWGGWDGREEIVARFVERIRVKFIA